MGRCRSGGDECAVPGYFGEFLHYLRTRVSLGFEANRWPNAQLWKRRHLEVDTQGYLVLNPHDTSKARGSDKLERRYHLSQFFPPFAPDMERMEMPYSVVLDFRDDGGTLQVAADSGLGQSGLLRGGFFFCLGDDV